MCDGVYDCDNERDEQICTQYLQSNILIGSEYKVDEIMNGSQVIVTHDIMSSNTSTVCNDPLYQPCRTGYNQPCYPRYEVCLYRENIYGHLIPCTNAEHLQVCLEHQCPNMFKCTNTYCIPRENVCDGIIQCPHGEDESMCIYDTRSLCQGLYKCKDSHICIDL